MMLSKPQRAALISLIRSPHPCWLDGRVAPSLTSLGLVERSGVGWKGLAYNYVLTNAGRELAHRLVREAAAQVERRDRDRARVGDAAREP